MPTFKIVPLLLITFVISMKAGAYSPEECDEFLKSSASSRGGDSFGLMFLSTTVESVARAGSGSSSFVSSTGDCAQNRDDVRVVRRQFIAVNLEKLQNECARGRGENLETLLGLYGCTGSELTSRRDRLKESCEQTFLKAQPPAEIEMQLRSLAACR